MELRSSRDAAMDENTGCVQRRSRSFSGFEIPMIANLRPYSSYKPSGISWIGNIPCHWKLVRFRNILSEKTERNRSDSPLLSVVREKGVILRDVDNWDENPNFIPDDLSNYKVVRKGQFAMNKMKAWQGSYGVSQYEGIVSPAYFVFDVNAVMADYFHVAVRSKAFVPFFGQASDGVRIGQWDLSQTRMREIPFWVPPLPEQAAIVRYLDRIDERVRRYITGKQKLLRLLREEKQVVIRRSVTRGLDQGVRLSPSGNEWLGDMPAHWASRRLKTICSMNSGNGITATSIESSGTYPVYGGNGLRGYSSHFTHEGEFALIGRQGALCGNVHIARGRFWASEHAVVATLHSGQVLEWFGAILEAMNLNQHSIAAAQPGLAVERILNLWIPVPPPAEQAVIATRIEKQTAVIDTAIKRTRRQIELMQEYRTRIISDVVTGKLDVSGTAADLPVKFAEAAPADNIPI